MSKPLENIVRPFIAPTDIFSRSRQQPVTTPPSIVIPPDVHTIWSGDADSAYRDDGKQWYMNFSTDLKEDKTQRVSKLVKVTNPDDPEQKLYVERIDKTVFKDDFGKETKLTFDWSSPKDSAT